jgi:hypothetical protein
VTPGRGGGVTYLDGNNLMGRIPGAGGRDGRLALLRHLGHHRVPRPCCVVFDGPPPARGARREESHGPVRILYAAPESADSVIRKRVRPGDIVVTDDFELQGSCRAAGARIVRGEDFLRSLKPRGGEKPEKPAGPAKGEVEELLALFGPEDPP